MVVKMVTGFDANGKIEEDLSKAVQLIEAEFDERTGFLLKERISVAREKKMINPAQLQGKPEPTGVGT